MPREKSADVAHEQLTDHRIQRRPSQRVPEGTLDLTLVGGGQASDRDLGLAYFQFAKHGDQQSGRKAMSLLQRAEREGDTQSDADLHRALGFLAHLSGDPLAAKLEYQAALRANPQDSVAAADLAILDARAGDVKNAIPLLRAVSQGDPGETAATMDLAMIECAVGNPPAAAMALRHLLEFSPDDGKARQMLAAMESKANTCGHEK
jgi:predicted Zn-dependent protease